MFWRTLTFLCVWIVWIAVLHMDVSSNQSCRRCHRQWRSFYLVSQRPCDRVDSFSSVSKFMGVALDRYHGLIGIGLACSAVVLTEILHGSRKQSILLRDIHHGRRLERLTSISRMLLVFAGAFASWLYYLQMRTSREHCITRIAHYLLFGTSWEIVNVRPCYDPRDLTVLARQLFSNNRVLIMLGIDLAVTAVVLVEGIIMTVMSVQGWRTFRRGRGAAIPATPSPSLATLVTFSSGSSGSMEQQQQTLLFQPNLPNMSNTTVRSNDRIFVNKNDGRSSHAIVILDSPASPGRSSSVRDSAMRRLDRILEDALDESTIFQTSFASSSEESY